MARAILLLVATLFALPAFAGSTGYKPPYSPFDDQGAYFSTDSSILLETFDQRVTPIAGSSTYFTTHQMWARNAAALSSPDNTYLLSLDMEHEDGGINTNAGKTTHGNLNIKTFNNTAGQLFSLVIESYGSMGDNIGAFINVYATGATPLGGNEGSAGIRAAVRDYDLVVTGTSAVYSGGSVETIDVGSVTGVELNRIVEGNLMVWTDSPTTVNITGYDSGTRTWTYDSPADADFSDRCFAIDASAYDDSGATESYVWLYIDSDGVSTFTTQLRASASGDTITGAPNGYATSGAGRVAKACERVVSIEKDPNGDGNTVDATITIAGADWTNPDSFQTNVTNGSCASNCDFQIVPHPQAEMIGFHSVTETRQGAAFTEGFRATCLAGDTASKDCDNGFNTSGDWVNALKTVMTADGVNGLFVQSAQDTADTQAVIKANVNNQSGTDGFWPLIEIWENSGFVTGLNMDVSGTSEDLTWGDDSTTDYSLLTIHHVAGPWVATAGTVMTTQENQCMSMFGTATAASPTFRTCEGSATNLWYEMLWPIDSSVTTTVDKLCCQAGEIGGGVWDFGDQASVCVVSHGAQEIGVTEVASGCMNMTDLDDTADVGRTYCTDIGTTLASTVMGIGIQLDTDTVDTGGGEFLRMNCRITLEETR